MAFPIGWGVNVERLPIILRVGIGEVTVDPRLGGEERGSHGKDEEQQRGAPN